MSPVADPLELSYLAGIFDGEGSIYSTLRAKKVSPSVNVQVGVTMRTHAGGDVVSRFGEIWGGSVWERQYETRPNRSPVTRWAATDRKALAFLRDILPFLKVKRPQAELAISFYETRIPARPRGFGKGTFPLTPEAVAQRLAFRDDLRRLNR